jgi:hypothetical protein
MTSTDYILDITLILLVLLQIKERPFTRQAIIRPLVVVGIAAASYFHTLPTAGNDLALIIACTLLGVMIGTASGYATIMRPSSNGEVLVRAGLTAATLWVLGMGIRFAFIFWMTHGGAGTVTHFSSIHQITSTAAWTDALLGMALGEVLSRTGTLLARKHTIQTRRHAYPVAA